MYVCIRNCLRIRLGRPFLVKAKTFMRQAENAVMGSYFFNSRPPRVKPMYLTLIVHHPFKINETGRSHYLHSIKTL